MLIWGSFSLNSVYGQTPSYISNLNNQLRHIFSDISYPNNDVLFLYDRSVKLSDTTFYRNNAPDTCNAMIWRQIYKEIFYAAKDTTPLENIDEVLDDAYKFYGDTIPLGIMDYDYYRCKQAALNTGNYFIFDIPNNLFHDDPNAIGSPYTDSNIFMVSPLKSTATYSNPTFRIAPNLFFSDNINTPLYQYSDVFSVDFGDGTGAHFFNVNQVSYYQAHYTATGNYTITAKLKPHGDHPDKYSKSKVTVLNKSAPIPPSAYLTNVPGLNVGMYSNCHAQGADKIIIYLEGFDPLDFKPAWDRNVEDIYDNMISAKNGYYLGNLQRFNYTFYVVDWKNSRIDMRFNALYLVNFIEMLKQQYQNSNKQFVIIGESMGGVVARYALTYMESTQYQNNDYSPFFVDAGTLQDMAYLNNHPELYELGDLNRNLVSQTHKTRLLITLDSPHQGANVPLSVQYAYNKLFHFIPGFQLLTAATNMGLQSYAAKEMLLYHIDSKTNPFLSSFQYTADPAYGSFYGQLKDLGNYPQHCKIMALSSGSLKGNNQLNIYGNSRVANDILLEQHLQLYCNLLWLIHIPLMKPDYTLRTNPDGTGTFYEAGVGQYTFHLKLKLFGINLNTTFGNLYSDNQIAVNAKSYGVSAGGYYGFQIDFSLWPHNAFQFSPHPLFNIFGYNLHNSQNCFYLNSHAGWQGMASINLDFSLCTDGTIFGFVPVQSALDYGNGLNIALNHDILNENINTKLSRTPFDVIMGYPYDNHPHLDYREEAIYNITGNPAVNCPYSVTEPDNDKTFYDADQSNNCGVIRGILTQAIGDEELYLENWNLNRPATFQAEYALYVNKRNPYYQYPSTTNSTLLNLKGIYSKEASFYIDPTLGHATFISNGADSPAGTGFVYNNQQPANLWNSVINQQMLVCMQEPPRLRNPQQDLIHWSNNAYLKLYPNPTNDKSVTIVYDLPGESTVNIAIYNITGQKVYELKNIKGEKNSATLNLNKLAKGMYITRITGNQHHKNLKLIID